MKILSDIHFDYTSVVAVFEFFGVSGPVGPLAPRNTSWWGFSLGVEKGFSTRIRWVDVASTCPPANEEKRTISEDLSAPNRAILCTLKTLSSLIREVEVFPTN